MNWYLIAYEAATGGQWRRCDAADEWAACLANLASGLRDAGALCFSYEVGRIAADAVRDHYDDVHKWQPGCGRPMPGWE